MQALWYAWAEKKETEGCVLLNYAAVMGRLTAAPELRETPNGTLYCRFTLAVERMRQKDREPQTDFIDCVAWRQRAQLLCSYFEKGQLVAAEGAIQTRSYEDKNGVRRKAVELAVSGLHFCGAKRDAQQGACGPASDPDGDSDDLPF